MWSIPQEAGTWVSICQADYWLPQERLCTAAIPRIERFNLPSRLLASPRYRAWARSRAHSGFNLPSRLLASPRAAAPWVTVSLAMFQSAKQITGFPKAALSLTDIQTQRFQSAKQITGFPKRRFQPSNVRRIEFQSAKQITGFPKHSCASLLIALKVVSICQADYWLPQASGARRRGSGGPCFNLPSRLLASPSWSMVVPFV